MYAPALAAAPAEPAAGAKRAREDLGAELPASFDEALPKQPPGEVAAVELGAGAVGAHALVASELADAKIATAPEASTCVGAVVGVGLDLGYGSSDEESEDEESESETFPFLWCFFNTRVNIFTESLSPFFFFPFFTHSTIRSSASHCSRESL